MSFQRFLIYGTAFAYFVLEGCATNAWSQQPPLTPPTEVDLPADWEIGEIRKYEIVKSRETTRSGKLVKGTGTTPLDIEVLEANDTGYLIGWKFGPTSIEDQQAAKDPLTQQMAQIMAGFQIQLEVDRAPAVAGVRNWQAFKAKIDETFELTAKVMRNAGRDEATIKKVIEQSKSMFASQDQINAFLTRDAQMFFFVLGGSYSTEEFHYDDVLANPFGGEPIPTKGTLRLKELNDDNAVIAWSQTIDERASAAIFTDMIKKFSIELKKDPSEIDFDFTVFDKAEFIVDRETGWLRRLAHTRKTTSNSNSRSDKLVIRRRVEESPSHQ